MFTKEFEKVAVKKAPLKSIAKKIKGHIKAHGYGPAIAVGSVGTAIGANRTANNSAHKEHERDW